METNYFSKHVFLMKSDDEYNQLNVLVVIDYRKESINSLARIEAINNIAFQLSHLKTLLPQILI